MSEGQPQSVVAQAQDVAVNLASTVSEILQLGAQSDAVVQTGQFAEIAFSKL